MKILKLTLVYAIIQICENGKGNKNAIKENLMKVGNTIKQSTRKTGEKITKIFKSSKTEKSTEISESSTPVVQASEPTNPSEPAQTKKSLYPDLNNLKKQSEEEKKEISKKEGNVLKFLKESKKDEKITKPTIKMVETKNIVESRDDNKSIRNAKEEIVVAHNEDPKKHLPVLQASEPKTKNPEKVTKGNVITFIILVFAFIGILVTLFMYNNS